MGATVIHSDVRTIKKRGLVAKAGHVVHREQAWHRTKVRLCSGTSRGVSEHPANHKSIFHIMIIVADWLATNKDISLMRSRSPNQLHLWDAAVGKRLSMSPEVSAVVFPTDVVFDTFIVAIAVAVPLCARSAACAKVPIKSCSCSIS